MPKTNLAKGTLYLAIANLVFMLTGYAIYFWLGKTLDPASYGVYALIITIISLLNLLFISGMPTAVAKFISEDENKAIAIRNKAIKIQFIASIIIAIIYFLLSPLIADLLSDNSLTTLLRISAITIPLYAVYSVINSYYNGQHRFGKQSILTIIYSVAKMLLVIGLVYVFHIKGAILGFALSPLIALVFALEFNKSKESYDSNKLIRFAIPIIIFSIAITLISTLDLLMIKSLLKDNALTGFYSAAERISKVPYFFLIAIGAVLLPGISSSLKNETIDKTKGMINKSLKILLLMLIPGTLLISLSSQKIVSLLYSKEYLQAGLPLSILIFGAGFLAIFSILASILNASNRPTTSMVIALIGIPISLVLNYILIGRYGLTGAAIATTATTFVMAFAATISVYFLHNTLVSIKSIAKMTIASIAISIPIIYVKNVYMLIIAYPILLLIYLTIMIISKEITIDDIKKLLPGKTTVELE